MSRLRGGLSSVEERCWGDDEGQRSWNSQGMVMGSCNLQARWSGNAGLDLAGESLLVLSSVLEVKGMSVWSAAALGLFGAVARCEPSSETDVK